MKTTWILVANASYARIYTSHHVGHELELVEEHHHPESREKGLDLLADRLGHQQSQAGSGTMVEPTNPKEVEAERFAHYLADSLNHARVDHRFDDLIIVSAPHFHGLLNGCCDGQVLSKVTHHIDKDYTNITERELSEHLREIVHKHWE